MFKFLLVVIGLLVAFVMLKNANKKYQGGPRIFRGPSFSKSRREKNMGELVKDPVSGTYVAIGKASKRTVDGKDYYFETEENAIEFLDNPKKYSN